MPTRKKSLRWTWLTKKDYNYWLVLYHTKKLTWKKKPSEFRISRNRLNKFLTATTRGEHTTIARHYWADLWNLTAGESFDQISQIQQKYADLPDSLSNHLKWELFNYLTSPSPKKDKFRNLP